jgi:hypothetical protein
MGLPCVVHRPLRAKIFEVLEEANREPRGVRRAEGRGFSNDRSHYRTIQDIGLELHQQIVFDQIPLALPCVVFLSAKIAAALRLLSADLAISFTHRIYALLIHFRRRVVQYKRDTIFCEKV